jgi:O-antigen biosynthesis protein
MESGREDARPEGLDPDDRDAKILAMVQGASRAVDFGCGAGPIAKLLADRGCAVIGIDISEAAAGAASAYCEDVIVADLDDIDLAGALGGNLFDVAVFADVIEHLKDPKRLLTQARDLLAPGGYIVVSVPNVAHASVRLELLKGQFSYEETGILDNTHLRYYTRSSIADLLASCGYMVEVMDWVELKVSEDELHETLDPLGLANLSEVVKAFSEWEAVAYQYIIKAFPASEEARLARMSEDKIVAERKVKVLQREVAELREASGSMSRMAEQLTEAQHEIEKSGEYAKSLERMIADKDAFIEQLEAAVAESRKRLGECEVQISGMAQAVQELEEARQSGRKYRRK